MAAEKEAKTPSKQGPTTESFLDAYAGFIGPAVAVVAAGILYVLYQEQLISEAGAGLAVALGVGLLCSSFVYSAAVSAAKNAGDRNIGLVFSGLTLILTGGLSAYAITPGAPSAQAELNGVGETMPLPAGLDGAVRLLVHGDIGGEEEATINFELGGGEKPIAGHLVRKVGLSRSRKGVRNRVATEQNSAFVGATLNSAERTLTLKSLNGPLKGSLHVSVFKDYLPRPAAYTLAFGFVIIAAVVSVKRRWKDSAILAVGLAAAFGLVVNLNGTPDAAIRPEIGALFIGFLGGGFGGSFIAWVLKRVLKDNAEKPAMA